VAVLKYGLKNTASGYGKDVEEVIDLIGHPNEISAVHRVPASLKALGQDIPVDRSPDARTGTDFALIEAALGD
jgi:hypothetical protein